MYSSALNVAPTEYEGRAVYYANRAACFEHIGDHAKVVEDCTKALHHRPEYLKVRNA